MCHGFRNAQPDNSGHDILGQLFQNAVTLRDKDFGFIAQPSPGCRQPHAPAVAFEQYDFQPVFQMPDAARNRGLRQSGRV